MTTFLPVIVAGVLMLVAITARRLNHVVQPLRIELARKAEDFIHGNPKPSKRAIAHAEFLLDTAFGMRWTILIAFFVVPLIGICVFFKPGLLKKFADTAPVEKELAVKFYEINRLHDRITLANHPILAPLLDVEILLIMVPLFIIRGAIAGFAAPHADRYSVLEVIERRSHRQAGFGAVPHGV